MYFFPKLTSSQLDIVNNKEKQQKIGVQTCNDFLARGQRNRKKQKTRQVCTIVEIVQQDTDFFLKEYVFFFKQPQVCHHEAVHAECYFSGVNRRFLKREAVKKHFKRDLWHQKVKDA